jgi:hypothetical protein
VIFVEMVWRGMEAVTKFFDEEHDAASRRGPAAVPAPERPAVLQHHRLFTDTLLEGRLRGPVMRTPDDLPLANAFDDRGFVVGDIGYITPNDRLECREQEILAERERKPEKASRRRAERRVRARARSGTCRREAVAA